MSLLFIQQRCSNISVSLSLKEVVVLASGEKGCSFRKRRGDGSGRGGGVRGWFISRNTTVFPRLLPLTSERQTLLDFFRQHPETYYAPVYPSATSSSGF